MRVGLAKGVSAFVYTLYFYLLLSQWICNMLASGVTFMRHVFELKCRFLIVTANKSCQLCLKHLGTLMTEKVGILKLLI